MYKKCGIKYHRLQILEEQGAKKESWLYLLKAL